MQYSHFCGQMTWSTLTKVWLPLTTFMHWQGRWGVLPNDTTVGNLTLICQIEVLNHCTRGCSMCWCWTRSNLSPPGPEQIEVTAGINIMLWLVVRSVTVSSRPDRGSAYETAQPTLSRSISPRWTGLVHCDPSQVSLPILSPCSPPLAVRQINITLLWGKLAHIKPNGFKHYSMISDQQ